MELSNISVLDIFKKAVSLTAWIIFFFFCILTLLFGITQNSAPGDKTYGLKIGLEQNILRASKIMDKEAAIQIEFTKRRLEETKKVISSTHAIESLDNLADEVSETKKTILNMDNPEKREEVATQYVETLTEVKGALEQEKKTTINNNVTVSPSNMPTQSYSQSNDYPAPTSKLTAFVRNSKPNALPTATPTNILPPPENRPLPPPTSIPIPTAIAVPTTTPQNNNAPALTNQINQTQQRIQQTIEELNKIKYDTKLKNKKEGEDNKTRENKTENEKKQDDNEKKKDNRERDKD